ncbi:hypothetical protein CK203_107760 [Vitis vinifera]|uniref:DUF4283 domain-containing protein n=1 Tax=Vitis vinifera TaxID=29760 RepID=A0A438CFI1_VITVI|nr:hypothetical protein CK203_107760 [Vitis vinifera]
MEEREKERERARERKIAREGESGGDEGSTEFAEGASHARPGNNVKRGGFGVESKRFEVEVEERRGRLHATIVERKGGISSWVRIGPMSLGIVFECLNLSIEDRRMGRWAREWKENGRMYSLSRDYNRGGCFLRLGVVDLEGKRFSVYIPRGKGEKGGWASMADTLRSLGCEEATKVAKEKERAAARVDITTEEVGRNLSKLGHCIVGTWNHNAAKGDDLRGWGSQLTRIWRLKGSLGLAKMERGKVLLEFEIPAEGGASFKDGKYFSWGGRSPFREVESGDGMFEGRGKEQRSVGAGSWAACLHVGSGYSEENWGRVWGLPCD